MTTEGSHCEAKQEKVEGNCRKLSTKAEREAWKQAERKADKQAPKEPLPGENGKKGKERAEG